MNQYAAQSSLLSTQVVLQSFYLSITHQIFAVIFPTILIAFLNAVGILNFRVTFIKTEVIMLILLIFRYLP